jgi:hypothetical protein
MDTDISALVVMELNLVMHNTFSSNDKREKDQQNKTHKMNKKLSKWRWKLHKSEKKIKWKNKLWSQILLI